MSMPNNCWIPKAGSGKGIGFMSLFLVFGLIGGVVIATVVQEFQPFNNLRSNTKINIEINDFYLKLYDGTDFLGLNASYELMGIMFYYMEFDLQIFQMLSQYMNVSDYLTRSNASDDPFGAMGIMNLNFIGNERMMVNMFSTSPTFEDQIDIKSIENRKFTLEWSDNTVILLNAVSFIVANRTSEHLQLIMGDSFDITGNNITDAEEEHLDIVNVTRLVEKYVYYPNIEYTLAFNGVDYDIGTEDFSNLYLTNEHGTSITVTDKKGIFMFV